MLDLCDSETGESVHCPFSSPPLSTISIRDGFDLETGEPDETNNISYPFEPSPHHTKPPTKSKFMVPKNLLAQDPTLTKSCCIDPNENYTLSRKEQVMTLQEV